MLSVYHLTIKIWVLVSALEAKAQIDFTGHMSNETYTKLVLVAFHLLSINPMETFTYCNVCMQCQVYNIHQQDFLLLLGNLV